MAANLGPWAPLTILETVVLAIAAQGVLLSIIGWRMRGAARREQPGLLVSALYRLMGAHSPVALPLAGRRPDSLHTNPEAGVGASAERKRPFDPSADALMSRFDGTYERLEASTDNFAQRLEHAAQNLLQCVEGMRSAAADLSRGAARMDSSFANMEAMQRHVEQMATQVAEIHARQESRLQLIAEGLYGITQSLTTVVASSNDTQASVTGIAVGVAGSVEHLNRSVERLIEQQTAQSTPWAPLLAGPSEGVTLRQVMEVQRQFINTLDDRLAGLTASLTPRSATRALQSRSVDCAQARKDEENVKVPSQRSSGRATLRCWLERVAG
jgi:hypothetical protein